VRIWPSCLLLIARKVRSRIEVIVLDMPVAGLSETSLTRFVTRARRAAQLEGTVSVLVTGSRALQNLNRRFRHKNRPTDVLSFPAAPGGARFAGDIAISVEIAARNAAELGHTTAEEVKILILHGILHLAGYDHETDHGQMARTEERMRRILGLPAGLIARNRAASSSPAGSFATVRNRKQG
jgi:probable rRNA maturation factor